MQCENGYIKPGVNGILCRKAEEPKDGDLQSIAHALCGHQRFCPNQRCYTMLPGWEQCTKRIETRKEAAESEITAEAGKPKGKKKSAKRALRVLDGAIGGLPHQRACWFAMTKWALHEAPQRIAMT